MTISDSNALTLEKENMWFCSFLKQFLVSNGNLLVSKEFAAVYFHCDLYLCFIFFLIITECVLCVLLTLVCICLFSIVSTLKYKKARGEKVARLFFSLVHFTQKHFLFLQLHNRYISVHFALEWGTWDKNTGCAKGTHTGIHGGKTFATVCHDL